MSDHVLWMFQVTGPGVCTVETGGNPDLHHSGGVSATHLMLTAEQAAQVEATLLAHGLAVRRWQTALQTSEQRDERLAIMGSEDLVLPCVECAQCYWFDPLVAGLCGRAAWPESMVVASLEAHSSAREGEALCPVQPWRDPDGPAT